MIKQPMYILQRLLCLVALIGVITTSCYADSTQPALPFVAPIFEDNMVLQRDQLDRIWGWATPGSTVIVSVSAHKVTAIADQDGKWQAQIGPFQLGKPFEITITGEHAVTLHNILAGDVWLCCGQSNMCLGMTDVAGGRDEANAANYPDIRLYTVGFASNLQAQKVNQINYNGDWAVCSPSTVLAEGQNDGFSAVGYRFGKELHLALNVPIGLIMSGLGGTAAQAWTSEPYVLQVPDYATELDNAEKIVHDANQKNNDSPDFTPEWLDHNTPTVLYNGMIAPITGLGIKGVIWYQGEQNNGHATLYRHILPAMIASWRSAWGQEDIPFYIVGLPSWQKRIDDPIDANAEGWVGIREAQQLVGQYYPNCATCVTYDTGDPENIHPINKAPVSHRLALLALAKTYHKKLEYSGPTLSSYKIQSDGKVELNFSHVGKGLVASAVTLITNQPDTPAGKLVGFQVCGDDKKWYWADATIDGNKVILTTRSVPKPTVIRYAWQDNPPGNLFNLDGIPATPFRTDGAPFEYAQLR